MTPKLSAKFIENVPKMYVIAYTVLIKSLLGRYFTFLLTKTSKKPSICFNYAEKM